MKCRVCEIDVAPIDGLCPICDAQVSDTCPYCGEECDGAEIQNGQQVCCGFGCEHCCEYDRDSDASSENSSP